MSNLTVMKCLFLSIALGSFGLQAATQSVLLPNDAQAVTVESLQLKKVALSSTKVGEVCWGSGLDEQCKEDFKTTYGEVLVATVSYEADSETQSVEDVWGHKSESNEGEVTVNFSISASPKVVAALRADKKLNKNGKKNRLFAQQVLRTSVTTIQTKKNVVDYDLTDLCPLEENAYLNSQCKEKIVYKKVPTTAKLLKVTL